jgi:carbamoyltransferase
MNIIGLNFNHDGSIAIVKDGKLVVAVGTERVSRIKKDHGVTVETLEYAIREANLFLDDIDAIALADFQLDWRHEKILTLSLGAFPVLNTQNVVHGNKHIIVEGLLLGRKKVPVYIIPHHMSHAASAYYTSNYENSWVYTMDSSGGDIRQNSLIAKGEGNKLTAIEHPGMMVGIAYAIFTEAIGLGEAYKKAGSTMGLAAYGKPHPDLVENIAEYVKSSYYPDLTTQWTDYSGHFQALFDKWSGGKRKDELNMQEKFIMAASVQYLFENCVLDVLKKIPDDEIENLCLAGGSFLNCNTNTRVKNESRFKNLHLFPACGDDGNAVGSALYVAHHILDEPRHTYTTGEICYLGPDYITEEPDYDAVAQMLEEGYVVAWFMGRSEFGPRALGHRSLLADPRNQHMRELLNFSVKNREWFRPFAPVVPAEDCADWFDFEGESPYMLHTAKVLQPEKIPAVTHIDGSARMQTVTEESNAPLYKLLKAFEKRTGVPILINTSLNGSDEPILETEVDAMNYLYSGPVVCLVLNGRLLTR